MKEYNFLFNLRLRFANPHQIGTFVEHSAYFKKCIDEYNKICEGSSNKKHIDVLSFSENYIEIALYSNADLNKAPGRALSLLTRLLLDEKNDCYDSYYSKHVYHNKLFLTEMFLPKQNREIITDADFIKGLIDFLAKPKSLVTEKERSTMNRIKLIAKESELV